MYDVPEEDVQRPKLDPRERIELKRKLAEARASLETRARLLASLMEHDGWAELQKVVAETSERNYSDLARRLRNPDRTTLPFGPPVDQRAIDTLRGHWEGIEWVLAIPKQAATDLEAHINRVERLLPDDPDETQEEE